ncbi:hypothetical protein NKH72_22020 [Mesorhizobium sp. M0955]|uniref:hypothetical protein n=1 Tax=Mesorhizobium sp. M0955 TaxID=2957033 RepID=UPI0033359188
MMRLKIIQEATTVDVHLTLAEQKEATLIYIAKRLKIAPELILEAEILDAGECVPFDDLWDELGFRIHINKKVA